MMRAILAESLPRHACMPRPPQTCYMHSVSKATSWQHPRDEYFKSLVTRNRERVVFVEAVLRNNSMYATRPSSTVFL